MSEFFKENNINILTRGEKSIDESRDDKSSSYIRPLSFSLYDEELNDLSSENLVDKIKNNEFIIYMIMDEQCIAPTETYGWFMKDELKQMFEKPAPVQIQRVQNIPLLKLKPNSNAEHDIYYLAIQYINCMLKTNADLSNLYVCIEAFPKVFVLINKDVKYSKDNNGEIHLTEKFSNGELEIIISNDCIAMNACLNKIWHKYKYNVIKNNEDLRSCYISEEMIGDLDKFRHRVRNKTHKTHQRRFMGERRQSYINNLKRTAEQKPLKTPLALCGFDQSNQKGIFCLCGKGCCDLNDVEMDNQEHASIGDNN